MHRLGITRFTLGRGELIAERREGDGRASDRAMVLRPVAVVRAGEQEVVAVGTLPVLHIPGPALLDVATDLSQLDELRHATLSL